MTSQGRSAGHGLHAVHAALCQRLQTRQSYVAIRHAKARDTPVERRADGSPVVITNCYLQGLIVDGQWSIRIDGGL